MAKLRKMLGNAESPYILSMMHLIETQSKVTLANWSLDYAEKHMLPLYQAAYAKDERPLAALQAARQWLAGELKLPAVKKLILEAHEAAREAEETPIAQAAARAIGQAASCVHAPTHALGMVFYALAAHAYSRAGLAERQEIYDLMAADICAEIEADLQGRAVANEPNPIKVNWNC